MKTFMYLLTRYVYKWSSKPLAFLFFVKDEEAVYWVLSEYGILDGAKFIYLSIYLRNTDKMFIVCRCYLRGVNILPSHYQLVLRDTFLVIARAYLLHIILTRMKKFGSLGITVKYSFGQYVLLRYTNWYLAGNTILPLSKHLYLTLWSFCPFTVTG